MRLLADGVLKEHRGRNEKQNGNVKGGEGAEKALTKKQAKTGLL